MEECVWNLGAGFDGAAICAGECKKHKKGTAIHRVRLYKHKRGGVAGAHKKQEKRKKRTQQGEGDKTGLVAVEENDVSLDSEREG